ncbi:MAG: S8 family serine peptidase [Hyphomicrobiaceae bacterium]
MKLSVSKNQTIELEELPEQSVATRHGRQIIIQGGESSARFTNLVNNAARAHFEMPDAVRMEAGSRSLVKAAGKVRPAIFREKESQLLRMVYKELTLRFRDGLSSRVRNQILRTHGLEVRRRGGFDRSLFVVHDPSRKILAQRVVEVSNDLMQLDDIEMASPNFVSEFPRDAVPRPSSTQWHLHHPSGSNQAQGSDVDIREAWKTSMGSPQIVIAVLDDGIDVDHPNLRDSIVSRPDPNDPHDLVGRDFFVPDDHPEHFNPRPKLFRFPFDRMAGNDIHGTPCAGVAASSGRLNRIYGAAPACRILPVKIFHADDLASESRVADAIAYAATFADVLSCSWSGPTSAIIETTLRDVANGWEGSRRGNLGTPVFCATGNDGVNRVSYPARSDHTMGVGATTDQADIAGYSNRGPEVWVSAPSSGGARSIMTTDVGYQNRGFNLGTHNAGGVDGFHTNGFGGTSSATPLVAGIAALVLSVGPDLSLDEVKTILRDTSDKIGAGYSGNPSHSPKFGYGRVNAGAAVAAAVGALRLAA